MSHDEEKKQKQENKNEIGGEEIPQSPSRTLSVLSTQGPSRSPSVLSTTSPSRSPSRTPSSKKIIVNIIEPEEILSSKKIIEDIIEPEEISSSKKTIVYIIEPQKKIMSSFKGTTIK